MTSEKGVPLREWEGKAAGGGRGRCERLVKVPLVKPPKGGGVKATTPPISSGTGSQFELEGRGMYPVASKARGTLC